MSTIELSRASLADRPIGDAITTRGKELPETASVAEANALFASGSVQLIPLLHEDGGYVGALLRESLTDARADDPVGPLVNTETPVARASSPADEALALLDATGGRRLVVVDDAGAYVGLVCLRSDRARLCVDAECHAAPSPVDRLSTVAALVLEHPARSRVFEQIGIDFCCGGGIPLETACVNQGLDVVEVIARLDEVAGATDPEENLADASIAELVSHILETHHAYLRSELAPLGALVDKVVRAHGDAHPELAEIQQTFTAIEQELLDHMPKEELVLFPLCLELDAGAKTGPAIAAPIAVMVAEHAEVGGELARLRSLTSDYAVPEDACNSYRAMLDRLATLEADTHRHIHEENNILFPRALELAGVAA